MESSAEEHGWWIRAEPGAPGAIGFTLGISDEGEYDLFLENGFAHEGWPWPAGLDPVELCRAIAEGRVRAEVSLWRGRELRRLVAIDCPPEIWTDLNVSLFDLLVPAGWRSRRIDAAAAY